MSNDRTKTEGLYPTLSINRFKNDSLAPTLSIDRFKSTKASIDIVDWSIRFAMTDAKLWLTALWNSSLVGWEKGFNFPSKYYFAAASIGTEV